MSFVIYLSLRICILYLSLLLYVICWCVHTKYFCLMINLSLTLAEGIPQFIWHRPQRVLRYNSFWYHPFLLCIAQNTLVPQLALSHLSTAPPPPPPPPSSGQRCHVGASPAATPTHQSAPPDSKKSPFRGTQPTPASEPAWGSSAKRSHGSRSVLGGARAWPLHSRLWAGGAVFSWNSEERSSKRHLFTNRKRLPSSLSQNAACINQPSVCVMRRFEWRFDVMYDDRFSHSEEGGSLGYSVSLWCWCQCLCPCDSSGVTARGEGEIETAKPPTARRQLTRGGARSGRLALLWYCQEYAIVN